MKKIHLLLIALTFAASAGSAFAQDTVDLRQKDNYFSHSGCDLDSILNAKYIIAQCIASGYYDECGSEHGYRFHTDTAITIYGIAAGLIEPFAEESVYDTSYDRSIQYLRIYTHSGGSLQWVRQARIHMHHTPISYYAESYDFLNLDPYIPMYERYFDSALTINGTFYCGLTFSARQPYHADDGHTYGLEFREFWLMGLSANTWGSDYYCRDSLFSSPIDCDGSRSWYFDEAQPKVKPLLFPILTPPDSTYVPDDSLSVEEPNMIDRMTGVMPNPA